MSLRRWNSAPPEHSSSECVADLFVTAEAETLMSPSSVFQKKSDPEPLNSTSSSTVSSVMIAESVEQDLPRVRGNGCGRGIVLDWKRTVGSHWVEEMTNFDQKTIAVSFFLFFACIAPAITFGAIYAKATHNWIGAVEMIAATSWCGITYGIIGGQPMMINGGTGPVLAFTEILFSMSQSLDVPFLTFNAWIGLWVCFYMFVAAFVDLNRIIAYATRFTDEIFALLISTIFIINALGDPFAPVGIYYYFESDHSSHEEHQDDPNYSYTSAALLSLLVCIGTVWLAFSLRKIKFSPFLPNQLARNVITDFAVVLSIVIMTLIANFLFSGIPLETLNVPDTFAPTYACCDETCKTNWPDDCPELKEPYQRRPWLVNLGDLNGKGWVVLMAAGPALLAFILVFLDDGITWHLINHPTHKLTHGTAYDYDTIIIGLMIAINSLLGFPWLVAATVRSLNHVHALAEKTPDGKILSVRETRLTGIFIHVLCLASIFALEVLKLIPMPALYGVFLFMGLVSLGTNQFWGRILMFFMQPAKYPIAPYTLHMKPLRMNLFTTIQLGVFVLLYVVKAIKTIAIIFPLIIAFCIPFRLYLLPRIFTEKELVMIDSDDETVKAWLAKYGESVEEPVQADDEEMQLQQEGLGDEEDEDEAAVQEEERDQVMPLPSERKDRHRRRQKAISCPPHMLFAEVPLSGSNVSVAMAPSSMEPYPATEPSIPSRPRRRRTKAVSCPPHMLFAEAERHIASNYFFG